MKEITFDAIDLLCREEGNCLVWTGSVASDGKPIACVCGKTIRLRKVVWSMVHGKDVPRDRRVSDSCGNPLCLTPSHLKAMTTREYMAQASQRGKLVCPIKAAKNRATWQAKAPKLNIEKARVIRSRVQAREVTGETLHSIAADYGVHFSLVDRIGKGLAWAEPGAARGSSVFSMASAA